MKNSSIFKSWQKTVIVLLSSIFLCSMVSLITTIVYYQKQMKQTYINENNIICDNWISSIDTRLTFIHEQIHDIFLDLYNNTEFQKSPNSIDAFTSKKIVEMLQKKTIATEDISAIFLYDENSDYYVYNANSKSNISLLPMVKSYLKSICLDTSQYMTDYSWDIRLIGGKQFFYKSIKLGRFIVGAISDSELYKFKESVESDDFGSFLTGNGNTILSTGNEELINYVDANSSNTSVKNRYICATILGENSSIAGSLVVRKNVANINVITSILFLTNAILGIVLLVFFFSYMRRRILVPTNTLIEATKEVSKGNLSYRVDENVAGSDEFSELYRNFNNMTEQIGNLKIQEYDMKLKEEENKLRMTRGQLRPHTFMNGITTISNLTYDNNPDKVREYIYEFSRFTRYMLNTNNEWTTIKEELKQIENYIEMQKIKFPNSIDYACDIDPTIEDVKIPYLLLFSLVENSFKHAMSLIQTLHIYIKCEKYEEEDFIGYRLIEEDDGDGFSNEAIEKLKNIDDMFTKEHLGLTNVRYTLRLLYKRDDLLRILNKQTGGARVELLIPKEDIE